MNYQKFIEQLSELYENWGEESVHPKSDQFQLLLGELQNRTTANLMQLCNFAADCLEPGEVYCQLGCFQNTALIGTLLNHPEQMGYVVDDFADFDSEDEKLEKWTEKLVKLGLAEQGFLYNQNFEQFFLELNELEVTEEIGLYFYDADSDYHSVLLGLLLVKPFLTEQALLIINNRNPTVRQAIDDFINDYPAAQILLHLPQFGTKIGEETPNIYILRWDVEKSQISSLNLLSDQHPKKVISEIYDLENQPEPQRLESLCQAAFILHQQGNLAEAEQKYQQFLLWEKHNFDAWFNLGMLYYTTERYQKAWQALAKCLAIDSSKAIGYYGLGLVWEKIDNIPEAIAAYQQAIVLDPNYIHAYNNLGNILYRKGDFPTAEKFYRQAIAVNPEHIDSYLNLGNIIRVQGFITDELLTIYEKALSIEPNNSEILAKLKKIRNEFLEYSANWKKLYLSWTLLSGLTIKIENASEWIVYNEIFVDGEYDLAIKQVLNSLKPDQVFRCLDLGANVGFFTIRLADLIMREKPQINFEVTLVEGSPQVFSNLQSRMSKIDILQDKIKLIWGLAGYSQGSEKILESDLFPAVNSTFSESAKKKGIDVQYIDLMTLYSQAQEIDLLKCDIEGSELILLENYPALFSRVNYAIFELHESYCDPNKCFQLLREYGFINHTRLREGSAFVEFFWK